LIQPGDTLNGIAARLLGDSTRWSDLYALNQSAAGGALAANPNLIRPGMQLHLPAPDSFTARAGSSSTTGLTGVTVWPS